MTNEIRIDARDLNLVFLVAPQDQGQLVEVAYAGTYDGRVLRRTTDRSLPLDAQVTYEVADLSDEAQERDEPCGLNDIPEVDGEWEPCVVRFA